MATILFWAFIALLAIAPLPLGGNRPVAWSFLALWTGVLFAAFGLAALIRPDVLALSWRRTRTPVIAFGLVALWIWLQLATWVPAGLVHPYWAQAAAELGTQVAGRITAAPDATATSLMRLLAYGAVCWMAMQLCGDPRRARLFLWAVAGIGSLYAGYGLAISFSGNRTLLWMEKWAYLESLTSTFVNRNSYATYAGIGLVATLTLLREQIGKATLAAIGLADGVDRRFVLGGLLGVMALLLATALFLTRSRGGILATVVGVAVLFAVGLRKDSPLPGRKIFAALTIGAALLVAAVSGGGVLQRLSGDPSGEDSQRPKIWRQSVAAIADRPILGHGYGSFENVFPAWQEPRQILAQQVDKAHNTYIELAFELGLPATLLLIAVPVLMLAFCLRALGRDGREAVFPTAALAISTVAGVHALVDFSLQMPAVAMTWAAVLGMGFAQSFRQDGERPSRRRPG